MVEEEEEGRERGNKMFAIRLWTHVTYILITGPRRKRFQLAACHVNLKINSATSTLFIAISQTDYVLLGSVPLR